jgi:major outer membrane protein
MTQAPHSRIFRALLPGACFIVLALAPATTPASAASDDFKGWLLALDVALTQPEGLDNHIATVINDTVIPPVTERIVMGNDADVSWRASIGYAFGLGMGQMKVSYWTFDTEDSENFTKTGFVVPALFGYGYYFDMRVGYGQPVQFSGGSGVTASTWDLDYSRSIELKDRFHLSWLAGLRTASYTEDQSFEGFDGYYTYQQSKSFDANAFGFRVGAGGEFGFTEHFSLSTSLAYSALLASTDGEASQTFVDGAFACGAPPCTEIRTGEDDDIGGSILDLELKGVWSAGPVDISLGLTNSKWSGFVRDPVPATGDLWVSESGSNDSVSFTSFEVGLIWRIGGSHRITSP